MKKFKFPSIFSLIFNKFNLNKVIIIFTFGLISRIFIGKIYNINVFIEYFNTISIIYSFLFSIFIVIIQGVVDYFNIDFIPSLILDFPSYIIDFYKYILNLFKSIINNILSKLKYELFRFHSIINYIKLLFVSFDDSIRMIINNSNQSYKTSINNDKPLISNVLKMDDNTSQPENKNRPLMPKPLPDDDDTLSDSNYDSQSDSNNRQRKTRAKIERGLARGEYTKFKQDARLEADKRWLEEKDKYLMSRREWSRYVDKPRLLELEKQKLLENNNVNNEPSSMASTSKFLWSHDPNYKLSFKEDIEKLKLNGSEVNSRRYVEAKLEANNRWLEEKDKYPNLSRRQWSRQIDQPRMKNNNSNNLPSIAEIPILNPSFYTSTLYRNLDLPPILNNSVSNSLGNSNYTGINKANTYNNTDNQNNTKYQHNNNNTYNNQGYTNNNQGNNTGNN